VVELRVGEEKVGRVGGEGIWFVERDAERVGRADKGVYLLPDLWRKVEESEGLGRHWAGESGTARHEDWKLLLIYLVHMRLAGLCSGSCRLLSKLR